MITACAKKLVELGAQKILECLMTWLFGMTFGLAAGLSCVYANKPQTILSLKIEFFFENT